MLTPKLLSTWQSWDVKHFDKYIVRSELAREQPKWQQSMDSAAAIAAATTINTHICRCALGRCHFRGSLFLNGNQTNWLFSLHNNTERDTEYCERENPPNRYRQSTNATQIVRYRSSLFLICIFYCEYRAIISNHCPGALQHRRLSCVNASHCLCALRFCWFFEFH